MKKTEVKDNLVEIAREAFLEHGYKGVSMRDISRLTGMALGNIYYYFKSKDDLYKEVLNPLISKLETVLLEHNKEENITLNVFSRAGEDYPFIWHFSDIVDQFRSELYLLFFQSQGSALEQYPDLLLDNVEVMGQEYLKRMKDKFPQLKTDVTPFFMRIIASIQITIMKELVSKRSIPDEEFRQFAVEYSKYTASGWKMLLGV